MSEWGDILEAIETEVRAALPDLPSGADGFERQDGIGSDLPLEQLPHVYLRTAAEAADALAGGYGAEVFSLVMTFSVWTAGETKEELLVRLDAIRSRIKANPTLGDVVDVANVVGRQTDEFPKKDRRQGTILIQAEVYR